MKTKLLLLLLAVCSLTELAAKSIPQSEAMSIAKRFFTVNGTSMMRVKANADYQLVYTEKNAANQSYFFVYNIGNDNGFVIVSADTRTKSILGYADTGRFDTSRMPENLKNWLQNYTEEIKYAIEKLPENDNGTSAKVKKAPAATAAVKPLLGLIAYDQEAPYNDSCPKIGNTNTVTGCVATAMAQVMRYHKWPLTGTGTKTYTPPKIGTPITADFGTTNYDWNNMLTSYSGNETTAQKAAVAKLMLHAGVSVSMDYDLANNGGSGAPSGECANAMFTYFGYNAGIQRYVRNYFTENEWIAKLKSELDAGRPILYSGSNSERGGHAFVCDGYDANTMFHFNWGWSGLSNGYYELSALNPAVQGIGSSNGGYNFNQEITTGIQKPVGGSQNGYIMGVDSIKSDVTSISRTGAANITFYKVFNIGGFTIPNGTLVYILTKDGMQDIVLRGVNAGNIPMGWGFEQYQMGVSFASTIPNGAYKLKLAYANENGVYVPCMASNKGFNAMDVVITDNNITFASPANLTAQLQLNDAPTTQNNLYQSKIGVFNIRISNTGSREYDDQIGVRLVKTDDPNTRQDVVTSLQHINPGEVLSLQMTGTITVPAGNYYVQIFYDPTNTPSSASFPTVMLGSGALIPTVAVAATPAAPALSTVSINMPSPVTLGEQVTLQASVKNTGGFYDGYLTAAVFLKNGSNYTYETQFRPLRAYIDTNQTQALNFVGALYGLTPGAQYAIALFAANQISNVVLFQVINPVPTDVAHTDSSVGALHIVNPVKNTLQISLPEKVETICIYTLQGKPVKIIGAAKRTFITAPVNDLPAGVYILKATGEGIHLTAKMIKE